MGNQGWIKKILKFTIAFTICVSVFKTNTFPYFSEKRDS